MPSDSVGTLLRCATQRRYTKGEYVLREGASTRALFQILSGSVSVELQLKDQPTAVVVGHRADGAIPAESNRRRPSTALPQPFH